MYGQYFFTYLFIEIFQMYRKVGINQYLYTLHLVLSVINILLYCSFLKSVCIYKLLLLLLSHLNFSFKYHGTSPQNTRLLLLLIIAMFRLRELNINAVPLGNTKSITGFLSCPSNVFFNPLPFCLREYVWLSCPHSVC